MSDVAEGTWMEMQINQFQMSSEAWRLIDNEAGRIDTNVNAPAMYARNYFRKGMAGFTSRLKGVESHFNALHAWLPRRVISRDYHLSNVLFNLASALDCFVFAMNALGNEKDSSQFRDVTIPKVLYAIGPEDVVGSSSYSGYAHYFPRFQELWRSKSTLIRAIAEYHGVTRVREVKDNGDATGRRDPPDGFFDGIREDGRRFYVPCEQIILGPEIEKPRGVRSKSWQTEPYSTLEQIVADFQPFIEESLRLALVDAKAM